MRRIVVVASFLAWLGPTGVDAEFLHIRQAIFGMDWAVCAHAVSVALRKIEGVDTVAVSLNEGVADIRLKPGNTVDPEVVREVVRDNGFTPKAADVSVAGHITDREGDLVLSVNGPELVYVLVEHPDAVGRLDDAKAMAMEGLVSVTGRLPEIAATRVDKAPRMLQLPDWRRFGR